MRMGGGHQGGSAPRHPCDAKCGVQDPQSIRPTLARLSLSETRARAPVTSRDPPLKPPADSSRPPMHCSARGKTFFFGASMQRGRRTGSRSIPRRLVGRARLRAEAEAAAAAEAEAEAAAARAASPAPSCVANTLCPGGWQWARAGGAWRRWSGERRRSMARRVRSWRVGPA